MAGVASFLISAVTIDTGVANQALGYEVKVHVVEIQSFTSSRSKQVTPSNA